MRSLFLFILTLVASFNVQAQPPGVSLEKFTGTWCGWCPYGAWALDSIEERMGDQAVVLAWHFNDKFEIKALDTIAAAISNGGHPVVSIARAPVISNRLRFDDTHPWYTAALQRLAADPAAMGSLGFIAYEPSNRTLSFSSVITPIDPEWPKTGVPLTVAILTEDDVIADQSHYDENGGQLPKLTNFSHQNVVRQVAGRVLGDSMSYAWGAGWHFLPYEITLDPKWNAAKTRLNILFLVRNDDGSITQVSAIRTRYLTELNTMSVGELQVAEIAIYPNPVSDKLTIDLPKKNDAVLEIFNALGQSVLKQHAVGGMIQLNTSHLSRGLYSVRIASGNETTIRQVIVQ